MLVKVAYFVTCILSPFLDLRERNLGIFWHYNAQKTDRFLTALV